MTSKGCHRSVAFGLLAALVLAGCGEASQVDRAATVVVSGRVLRADGTPAGGVPVGLERQPSIADLLGGVILVPLTLFTACLADPPPEVCRGRTVRRATTAGDGGYSFQLTGKDVQTTFGNASTLSVSAELPAAAGEVAGPAVTASFKVQTGQLRLPDLQAWQPKVSVAAGRIGWDALAGAGTYQVGIEDAGAQPVWSFDSQGAAVAFDQRILEDTAGTVAVSVRSKTTAEGTTVAVLRRSARVAYRSGAGVPVSRGKPCTHGTNAVTPCVLTDGNFANSVPAPASTSSTTATTAGATTDSVTVDLGQPRNVALVVVRGCTCQEDGSADGQLWTPLGRSTDDTAVVPARTGTARYVRLTGAVSQLREVSVWDGPAATATASPPAASASATSAPAASVGAPAPTAAPTPSRRGPALLALGLLLVAVIGGAGVVSRRR